MTFDPRHMSRTLLDGGDRAAARRLRPPERSKDWCDAYRADPLGLLRYLADALDRPELLALRHRLHVGWPAMLADPDGNAIQLWQPA